MRKLTALALCAIISFAAPAAAAELVVVDGKLTGATGVNVGGTLYNVSFADGSCVSLFSGCDDASDFAFQNEADAELAAQALLSQVFLDSGAGNFDTGNFYTGSISGCEFFSCNAQVAFGRVGIAVTGRGALNHPNEAYDYTFPVSGLAEYDLSNDIGSTFAVFTLTSSAVPEPGTWAMMLVGFGAVGFGMRRRNRESGLARQIA